MCAAIGVMLSGRQNVELVGTKREPEVIRSGVAEKEPVKYSDLRFPRR
jgi:hypothetical protein